MKNKKVLYIIIPILILITGLAWYFLYFINTPSYAVNKVREAYEKHDLDTFKRYVDTHAVMDAAFDDLIVAEDKINGNNVLTNSFAIGIIKLLKPHVVDLMEEELENKVKTDPSKQAVQATPKKKQADPITEAMQSNLRKRFPTDSLTVKNITIAKTEAGQAICTVIVFNKKNNKTQNIDLLMHVNQKEDWQIYKTKNLVEFLVETNNK